MWQYIIPAISAIVVAALTSGGLWALMGRRADRNEAERKMLVGLDNWHETVSLIDYNKLSAVSSLNWVEP